MRRCRIHSAVGALELPALFGQLGWPARLAVQALAAAVVARRTIAVHPYLYDIKIAFSCTLRILSAHDHDMNDLHGMHQTLQDPVRFGSRRTVVTFPRR